MAATTEVQTVNITINGTEVAVPKGELVVEAIKRMGIDVPIFCYHPRMKPVGMCRMCLIETGSKGPDGSIRMMPKPQTACSLPATEGLVIVTDSEKIHQDRKGVLEFLLINHPLDCPICDRGGECPLQNNTLFYGPSTSRFIEAKRHAPKAFPLSRHVTLDLERCIQCGRCVRFTEEISGDAQLAFRFRGASMQPSTFELRDFNSKFSGNVIEICPVGALTNTDYRFRARPWDLLTRQAICTNCSNGCNIFIDFRDNSLVRVNGRTNEHVNEEWTCDRGKFGHGFYNSERRLGRVLVRREDSLVPAEWTDAYREIVENFAGKGREAALLGGSSNSNEDLFALSSLFKEQFGSDRISFFAELRGYPVQNLASPPSLLADFEHAGTLFIFGSNLADEEPILYLRVRKGWVNSGAKIIVAASGDTDTDGFASTLLRYRPGTEAILLAGLASAMGAAGSDPSITPELVETQTGVSAAYLREVVEGLKDSGATFVATHRLANQDGFEALVHGLEALSSAVGGHLNVLPISANGAGASKIARSLVNSGASTEEILKACVSGEIKSLWVVGEDLLDYPDQDLVRNALEAVEFLVTQDLLETELTSFASLALPMAAPAEMLGTWTNVENRVQKMQPVLRPIDDAKPAWLAATEIAMRIEPDDRPFTPQDVLSRLASISEEFAGASYETIPDEGLVL